MDDGNCQLWDKVIHLSRYCKIWKKMNNHPQYLTQRRSGVSQIQQKNSLGFLKIGNCTYHQNQKKLVEYYGKFYEIIETILCLIKKMKFQDYLGKITFGILTKVAKFS